MKKYIKIFTLLVLAVAIRYSHVFLSNRNYDFTNPLNKLIPLVIFGLAGTTLVMHKYL